MAIKMVTAGLLQYYLFVIGEKCLFVFVSCLWIKSVNFVTLYSRLNRRQRWSY